MTGIPLPLEIATMNMALAVACGSLIGMERQVRQRMAGLRTNALVALGAASFVIFASLFPNEVSPTRVAAQVVSGIGFLGAGIIFRDGFTVHGLNTAATLWCSAGVGMLAGAGFSPYAVVATGFVVFVNLGLRPLVRFLKRHTKAGVPVMRQYRITLSAPSEREGPVRALVMSSFAVGGIHVVDIEARQGRGEVDLIVLINAEGLIDEAIEAIVRRLMLEPGLSRVNLAALD